MVRWPWFSGVFRLLTLNSKGVAQMHGMHAGLRHGLGEATLIWMYGDDGKQSTNLVINYPYTSLHVHAHTL